MRSWHAQCRTNRVVNRRRATGGGHCVRTCGTPATVETIGCCAAVVYGSYRHHIVVGHVANCVHGTAPCSGVLRRSVRTKACAVARAGIRIGSTVGCSETHVRRSRTRIRLHCAVQADARGVAAGAPSAPEAPQASPAPPAPPQSPTPPSTAAGTPGAAFGYARRHAGRTRRVDVELSADKGQPREVAGLTEEPNWWARQDSNL
jgi:hypothetical protein